LDSCPGKTQLGKIDATILRVLLLSNFLSTIGRQTGSPDREINLAVIPLFESRYSTSFLHEKLTNASLRLYIIPPGPFVNLEPSASAL